MAFSDFLKKAQPFIDKAKPLVDKAKEYGSQAVNYVGKQVEQTPVFLKTEEEYNIHASNKRAILIAFDERDPVGETIRLMMPIWWVEAWMDTAELRYMEISSNESLAKTLKITGSLEMRVSYTWTEYARYHTIDEVKAWWKHRIYKRDTDTKASTMTDSTDTTTPDPLKEIETNTTKRSK